MAPRGRTPCDLIGRVQVSRAGCAIHVTIQMTCRHLACVGVFPSLMQVSRWEDPPVNLGVGADSFTPSQVTGSGGQGAVGSWGWVALLPEVSARAPSIPRPCTGHSAPGSGTDQFGKPPPWCQWRSPLGAKTPSPPLARTLPPRTWSVPGQGRREEVDISADRPWVPVLAAGEEEPQAGG